MIFGGIQVSVHGGILGIEKVKSRVDDLIFCVTGLDSPLVLYLEICILSRFVTGGHSYQIAKRTEIRVVTYL